MHIGLNAHLLSGRAGYRSAGVHSYIHHLLTQLPAVVPSGWRLTALVGEQTEADYAGIAMRRARLNTESPLRRIVWEQTVQPWSLGEFDLYHALAFVAPLAVKRPFVVTVYDLSFVHYPERLPAARRLYLRLFTALTCRRAARVMAISHSTAADLTATFGIPADRIDVAAPGYDATHFRPLPAAEVTAFRAAHNLPDRFWLFVGTLEPRKNLVTLLEAYANLPDTERLPLILAGGKGWQYDDIFAAVERLNLREHVQFPGFIDPDVLPFWYNSADVFIYPSVFEGFGLPVLEAMACGKPVVTSNVSSLPEVVGKVGLALPPHDVQQWTDALHRAYTDGNWRAQSRRENPVAAQRYTWAATAQATAASYHRALNLSAD